LKHGCERDLNIKAFTGFIRYSFIFTENLVEKRAENLSEYLRKKIQNISKKNNISQVKT
jgi:hypothetical protein